MISWNVILAVKKTIWRLEKRRTNLSRIPSYLKIKILEWNDSLGHLVSAKRSWYRSTRQGNWKCLTQYWQLSHITNYVCLPVNRFLSAVQLNCKSRVLLNWATSSKFQLWKWNYNCGNCIGKLNSWSYERRRIQC